jgi:hypothetical protein
MAKVVFSALLSSASGKIGDIVMSRWKGIAYARRRVIPANPQSGDQQLQRYVLKTALLLWQSVKSWAKPPWTLAVTGYAWSGYNRFMDLCMHALEPQFTAGGQGADPTWSSPAVTVLTPYNAAYAELVDVQAGTGGANTITITWTARDGADSDDKVLPAYRLDDATAWIAQAEVLDSAETVTITGLVDASDYECALVPHEDALDVYGLSSHQIATAGV